MTRKLKILYHHRTASKDGQAVHIEGLVTAFRELGHEVLIVEPGMRASSYRSDGHWVGSLKRLMPKALYEWGEYRYSRLAYRRLAAAAESFGPDILYERYNLFLTAGAELKVTLGLPFFAEVNAPLTDERAAHGGLALESLARRTDRETWGAADYVLPVTDVLADYVRAAGVDDSHIEVIANGIDPAQFSLEKRTTRVRQELHLQGRTVLGFTGFLRDWHGLDSVVRVIAEDTGRHDLHFLIVGDGPAREEAERLADELAVGDRVTFAGLVPRDQIAEYISAFDVALQPRVTRYASPLKLFEYLAMGVAVIAPDQPNIREVLAHGKTGWLFDPDAPGAFAEAVTRLATDAPLRAELAARGAALIAEGGYTWRHNAERITALAEKLLSAKAGG